MSVVFKLLIYLFTLLLNKSMSIISYSHNLVHIASNIVGNWIQADRGERRYKGGEGIIHGSRSSDVLKDLGKGRNLCARIDVGISRDRLAHCMAAMFKSSCRYEDHYVLHQCKQR